MIWWCRAWRGRQANLPLPLTQGDGHGTATGADAAARGLFVKGSCAAAGSLETSPNLTEDDPIMTITPECEAQILRYFHVEKFPPTTIARQLNINRGTVKRGLARAGLPPIGLRPRPARIDPYLGSEEDTS